MTPIESIYEIKSAIIDLQKYHTLKIEWFPIERRRDTNDGSKDFLGKMSMW